MRVELIFITPDAEKLIENVGRTAYLSFDRQKNGSEKSFIKMLIKNQHFSVLEHAYASFRISEVSRAATHQLIRHRICSFIQQSQRYVNEKDFKYVIPDSINENHLLKSKYEKLMEEIRQLYKELLENGIRKEDARYVLPNATMTQIVVTANFREWRHIIEVRGEKSAQWEIRRIVIEVLKILKQYAPTCFEDLKINETKEIVYKEQI